MKNIRINSAMYTKPSIPETTTRLVVGAAVELGQIASIEVVFEVKVVFDVIVVLVEDPSFVTTE